MQGRDLFNVIYTITQLQVHKCYHLQMWENGFYKPLETTDDQCPDLADLIQDSIDIDAMAPLVIANDSAVVDEAGTGVKLSLDIAAFSNWWTNCLSRKMC